MCVISSLLEHWMMTTKGISRVNNVLYPINADKQIPDLRGWGKCYMYSYLKIKCKVKSHVCVCWLETWVTDIATDWRHMLSSHYWLKEKIEEIKLNKIKTENGTAVVIFVFMRVREKNWFHEFKIANEHRTNNKY